MQEKLLFAYEEVAVGKKTLIFNSGILPKDFVPLTVFVHITNISGSFIFF